MRNLRYLNHRTGAHTCTNQTVPYGTAHWGGAVPGTSCQATRTVPRDISIRPQLAGPFQPRNRSENRPRARTRFPFRRGGEVSRRRNGGGPDELEGSHVQSAFPRTKLPWSIGPKNRFRILPEISKPIDFPSRPRYKKRSLPLADWIAMNSVSGIG
jgi:hypothetical protein